MSIAQESTVKRKRGRPPSFDRSKMLNLFMHKFWKQGIGNVSINGLASHAGLTRASIYNSFYSKEKLAIEALDLYLKENSPDRFLRAVKQGDSVYDAFKALFQNVCQLREEDADRKGCFAVNAAADSAAQTGILQERIHSLFNERFALIEALLRQAVAQKEITKPADYAVQAQMMVTFMCGINVITRSNNPQTMSWDICQNFLQSFGFSAANKAETISQ
jgi:TetR/AcrR family transcriptional repressor of nem operon